MRYTIAAFAALASLAAAVPSYGYGEPAYPVNTPVVSSKAPEYPAYPVETPKVSTKQPEYPAYPVETPKVSSSKPAEYPSYPVETPKVSSKVPEYPVETPVHSKPTKPSQASESCLSSTTVTVTIPYPTGTATGPKPSKPAGEAPYPSHPAGTGYPHVPVGTATGVPVKPTYTKPAVPEFTGAASSLNAAGLVAGVGAFAAFFL